MVQEITQTEGKTGISYAFSVLIESIKDLFDDDGPQWAAAVAYYSLLSIFPLLLAATAIASYFVDQQWAVDQITSLLGSFLPEGSNQVTNIVEGVSEARGRVGIISILLLLWSGSRVFSALIKAINNAFNTKKEYSFFKRTAIELAMTITIGLLAIVALVSRSLLLFAGRQMSWFPEEQSLIFNIGFQILSGLILLLVFYLLYRFAPRMKMNNKPALWGAVFSAVVFLIARPLFLLYISRFSDMNLIYGSLTIVVILIIWMWLVAMIILLGGELAAHIERDQR